MEGYSGSDIQDIQENIYARGVDWFFSRIFQYFARTFIDIENPIEIILVTFFYGLSPRISILWTDYKSPRCIQEGAISRLYAYNTIPEQ